MSDDDDLTGGTDDDILRSIAHRALDATERTVDVGDGLSALRRRSATAPVVSEYRSRRGPSRWALLGAAAAVMGMVVAGVVMSSSDNRQDTIRTNTAPPITTPEPSVASTLPATSPTPPTTVGVVATSPPSPTTTDAVVLQTPQVIPVDAANPPPLLQPESFASIPLEPNPNGNRIGVAISTSWVAVKQPGVQFATIIGSTGPNRLDLEEDLGSIVAGPGNVLYGLGDHVDTFNFPLRFVAIPTSGDLKGQVVAATELSAVQYTELPRGAFGHGPDGIIDRARDVNATILPYVHLDGEPLEWTADAPPLLSMKQGTETPGQPLVVSVVGGDVGWNLDITYAPGNGGTYLTPSPPAPTTDGRVIYTEAIGADTRPDDEFATNSMPVIAILEPDGSGRWVRLPDDWSVAASDVWGTVLLRTTSTKVEVAMLDDALDRLDAELAEPPFEPLPGGEELAIGVQCVGEFGCTQLASMNDGRLVAYDPVDETLTVFDESGMTIEQVVPLVQPISDRGPWFVTVGPDNVAYFSVSQFSADPINELIPIPIEGPNAGISLPGYLGLDGSGDTDLVPTRDGLAQVGCCGFPPLRPEPDASTLPWVDSSGSPTTFTEPVFRLALGDGGNSLIRDDDGVVTSFEVPTLVTSPRGMPWVVATKDGGALMSIYDGGRSNSSWLIRFQTDWPEFRIDNSDVYLLSSDPNDRHDLALLEPSGTVILQEGDRFVRRTLEEIGTPGWTGSFEDETHSGSGVWITAPPGLNEYIDANEPAWAADPLTLAYQLTSQIGAAERYSAFYDELTGVLTIENSNFLDDSVYAVQREIVLEVGADGLYRFVSGTVAQQCQPGRGQQDFQPELCI